MCLAAVTLAVCLLAAGCGGEGDDGAAGPETIDLSRLAVVGDSLAAGVRSGLIEAQTQREAFPSLVAAQAGVDLPLPLLEAGRLDPDDPFRVNRDVQAWNLAVPGADARKALDARPDRPIDSLLDLMLGLPGLDEGVARSQVEWAEALGPTAVLVFIGNNDVLGAATRGEPGRATPLPEFTADMRAILGRLAGTGAALAVGTIPDVTGVAYLTPAETFASRVGRSLEAIGPRLGLAAGDRLTPQGVATALRVLAGATDGPVPETQVLTAAEAALVRATVDAFNGVIAAQAQAVGATVVDVRALFDRAATEGIPVGARMLTTAQGGGVFSADGVHPTATGQAILANVFIEALNERYGSRIPPVDVASVAARDPMVRAASVPGHVGQPLRGLFDPVAGLEQHAGGVPGPLDELAPGAVGDVGLDGPLAKPDGPGLDVHHPLGLRAPRRLLHEPLEVADVGRHAGDAEGRAVAEEDLAEGAPDDRLDPPPLQGLRSVLPRGAAAEVEPHDEDRGPLEPGVVEGMVAVLLAVVLEDVRPDAGEGDGLEVARRDDAVGVDVVARQRQEAPRDLRADVAGVGHLEHLPHVDDGPGDGGGGHHRRAHEEGPPGRAPLAALEVPVARGG